MIVFPLYPTPKLGAEYSETSVCYICTKLHGVKSGKYEIHHIVPVIRAEPTDRSLTTAICQTRSTNNIARPKSPTNSSVLPLFSHFNLWSDFCLWIFLTLKRFLCWLIDFPFSYAVGKSWRERERLQKVGEEEVGKWHWGWKGRGGVDENGSEIANYHESNFLLRSEHKVMA